MSNIPSVQMIQIIQALRKMRSNISVPYTFDEQMREINILKKNDQTGIINTVVDFMIHSATVSMQIETENLRLDENLSNWQKIYLNKDINIDIPRGLRELTSEYFKERWYSSFVALNIKWDVIDFGGKDNKWNMPVSMWFADGASLSVDGSESLLDGKKYYIGNSKKQLENTKTKSVIIRKPFNSWYEKYPTPFLVQRGILFNSLLKKAIIQKQADVIESVIPYLLLLKSGNDRLAELGLLANETEMKQLKDEIISAKQKHDVSGELGDLIATLAHDVNPEHFIPDLSKVLTPDLTKATDINILAGLGMIEVIGFGETRKETVLNPKMLIEEVKDGVSDWASMLEEVALQIVERNQGKHPIILNKEIRVVPGKIKAFMTPEMATLIASLYNKGLVSKQTTAEDAAELDFEVEVERRKKETADGLDKIMYAPIIQNQEQNQNDYGTTSPDTAPAKKSKDLKNPKDLKKQNAEEDLEDEQIYIEAPYNNVDDLPSSIKDNLPLVAQVIFVKAFNSAIKEGHSEEDSFKIAWGAVKRSYVKKDNKWVKKD